MQQYHPTQIPVASNQFPGAPEKLSFLLLVFLGFIFFFAPETGYAQGHEKIEVNYVAAPEVNLDNYTQIAISPVNTETGKDQENNPAYDIGEITNRVLLKTGRFTVLERQQLNSIIAEHKLALSGFVDESTATDLGKIIGAGVLAVIHVSINRYEEATYVRANIVEIAGCSYTNHRKGIYTVQATLKLIDVQTAKILGTKQLDASFFDDKSALCGNPDAINTEMLYRDCLHKIEKQVEQVFVKHDMRVTVSLLKSNKFNNFDKAIVFLKIGEFEDALRLLRNECDRTDLKETVKAMAYYNLGLVLYYMGKLDTAAEAMKKAVELDFEEQEYQQTLSNIKASKEKLKR